MADVQPENGFTIIAHELLEVVPKYKFNGTQLRIIMVVWRNTYGFGRKDHEMSITFFVKATGLGKTQIDRELKTLIEKKVLVVTKQSTFTKSRKLGFNKHYDEWSVEMTDSQRNRAQSAKTLTDSGNADEQSAKMRTQTVSEFADQDIYSFINNSIDKDDDVVDLEPEESDFMKQCSEIENYFCQKRGIGFNVNPTDFEDIKSVLVDGIPIEVIKQAIDHSFREYKSKHKRDAIRTFSYCTPRIYQEWEIWKSRQSGIPIRGHPKGGRANGEDITGRKYTPTQHNGYAAQKESQAAAEASAVSGYAAANTETDLNRFVRRQSQ